MGTRADHAAESIHGTGKRNWAIVSLACIMSLALLVWSQPRATAATTNTSSTTYYVVLGDSIAAGLDATSPWYTYPGLIYTHELSAFPGLQPVSYACSGATTVSMIEGPACLSNTGSQLGQAESFLVAHRGKVALVTIDIGMDNIIDCLYPPGINMSCVDAGLSQVSSQLPQILNGLKAADPGVSIVGMNYYDPFEVYWLLGGEYESWAVQSLNIVSTLNSELSSAYSAAGLPMADVFNGVAEPQDLVTLCTLTESCEGDPHPNNEGHAVIADTFYPLLPS
jgi:lysophospholipase L1-like esterase